MYLIFARVKTSYLASAMCFAEESNDLTSRHAMPFADFLSAIFMARKAMLFRYEFSKGVQRVLSRLLTAMTSYSFICSAVLVSGGGKSFD